MTDETENRGKILSNVLFLYINLDRSIRRREHMEAVGLAMDLNLRRLSAVDGHTAFSQYPEQEKLLFLKHHGRHMRPGELGCYLSHLAAIREFLKSEYEFAVILEDDAQFAEDIFELAPLFGSPMKRKWDFLRLQSRRRFLYLPLGNVNGKYRLRINLTRSTGSTAYALNRKAATVLEKSLLPILVPFDHAFDRPHCFGLKYRHLSPLIVTPAPHESTIEEALPKRGGLTSRMSTLTWRTKNEVARFLWSIREFVFSNSFRDG